MKAFYLNYAQDIKLYLFHLRQGCRINQIPPIHSLHDATVAKNFLYNWPFFKEKRIFLSIYLE